MSEDPWADVRGLLKWPVQHEDDIRFRHSLIGVLADADALLGVVKANIAFFPSAKDEWEFEGTEVPQAWWDLQNALAALPEYLRGGSV